MFMRPAAEPVSSNPPTRPAHCSHSEGGENNEMTTRPQIAKNTSEAHAHRQTAALRSRPFAHHGTSSNPEVLDQEIRGRPEDSLSRCDAARRAEVRRAERTEARENEKTGKGLRQDCGAQHRRAPPSRGG